MKWDIDEDPEHQPPGSTGLSERREVCLGYNHESVALSTEQSWHLLGESEIGRELRALMSLLNVQTEARKALGKAATEEETEVTPQAPFQQSDYIPPSGPSDSDLIESKEQVVATNVSSSEQSSDTGSFPKAQIISLSLSRSEIDEAYEDFEKLRYSEQCSSRAVFIKRFFR